MISRYFWVGLVFTLLQCTALSAQTNPIYARARVLGSSFVPVALEKILNQKVTISGVDTCTEYSIGEFLDYPQFRDTTAYQVCINPKYIEIRSSSVLRHFLPLDDQEDGVMFSRKSKIKRRIEFDSVKNTRYFIFEEISHPENSIILDYKTKVTLYEGQKTEQRRLFDSEVLNYIENKEAILPALVCRPDYFKPGDLIQFTIDTKNPQTQEWESGFALTHKLLRIDTVESGPRYVFLNQIIHLNEQFVENRDTLFLTHFSDGLFIGSNIGMPVAYFQPGLRIVNPETPGFVYYMQPMETPTLPFLEASAKSEISVGEESFPLFVYWNSTMQSPFRWMVDFPLPWRNTESLRQTPVFISSQNKTAGKIIDVYSSNKPFQLQQLSENKKAIQLDFNNTASKPVNLNFTVTNSALEVQKLTKPKHKIKKGKTIIELEFPNKEPNQYYLIKVFRETAKNQFELIYEIPYISRTDL